MNIIRSLIAILLLACTVSAQAQRVDTLPEITGLSGEEAQFLIYSPAEGGIVRLQDTNLFTSPSFTTKVSVSGGTVTSSTPVLNMTQTWNSSGVTFTGMLFNATSTASAAGSLLADFQLGGTSKLAIRKDGRALFGGGISIDPTSSSQLSDAGSGEVFGGYTGSLLRATAKHCFSSQNNGVSGNQTCWSRYADGVAEITNGTTGTWRNIAVSGIQGNAATKALTESSATIFVKIDVASNSSASGDIIYSIEANDASDRQRRSGRIPWVAVNKAGTITCTVGTVDAATEVVAVSAGTLTNTFTCADAGSNVLKLLANAVSSLTQTTLQIRYRVEEVGVNVVTPQ